MHSRAFLLLKKDLINIDRLPLVGISAQPLQDDNMYEWKAKVEGLVGTPWEGGIFQLHLSFTSLYNTVPPTVTFMTIPFHPNVDPITGRPSCQLLKLQWNEDCCLQTLLLYLQSLLSDPEMDSPCILNTDAAKMYYESPHTYRQLALDCIAASLRIDAGMSPYGSDIFRQDSSTPLSFIPYLSRTPSQKERKLKEISFDEYHSLWKGLATSVPSYTPNLHLQRLMVRDKTLKMVHSRSVPQSSMEHKMDRHFELKYGIPPKHKKENKKDASFRKKRIEDMLTLYTSGKMEESSLGIQTEEMDELLQWTTNLDEGKLDEEKLDT